MTGQREGLIALAHNLLDDGLVVRTWGNFSVRRSDGPGFLITPTGRDYRSMTPTELPVVQSDGTWEGPLKPSSEHPMHALVYATHPDVGCVIHTHQPYASALSLSGRDVVLSAAQAARLGQNRLPVSAYGLPGTKTLHKGVQAALDGFGGRAILLNAHGVLAFAADPEAARALANEVEAVATEIYQERLGVSPKAPVPTIARSEISQGQIRFFAPDGTRVTPSIETRQRHERLYRGNKSARAIVATTDPDVRACGDELLPYLDDFAQIAGLKADTTATHTVMLGADEALCAGVTVDDATNVALVLAKNAKAARIARQAGTKPIKAWECWLMNRVYQLKYSKQK